MPIRLRERFEVKFELFDSRVGRRNHLLIGGQGEKTVIFSHGFGCDQSMWRHVVPAIARRYRVALYDHVGAGGSDLSAYSESKYSSLKGYAENAVEICEELGVRDCVFVGHSVSAMIGAEAAVLAPERIGELVMVGPSPCYLNDGDYRGGFERADLEELLETLEANYLGWARTMAPVIMGRTDRPEFGEELGESFCRMDPVIAAQFARVTFFSDSRGILPRVKARTLVVQCTDDAIAPTAVGEYTAANLPNSELVYLKATGHCPNLSAPEETIAVISAFLKKGEGETGGD